jgi:hypothetical protein
MSEPRYIDVDLQDSSIDELRKFRDLVIRAIDRKTDQLEKRQGKARLPLKSEKVLPKSKKVTYSDTILVKNIPRAMLTPDKIIKEFDRFGYVTRLQILKDKNNKFTNSALVVFQDPAVAQDLVESKQPFKNARDEKKKIIVFQASHLAGPKEKEESKDSESEEEVEEED